ncbi:uncharacterized protein LOC113465617 [Diaphorina citri]|uniref:Uncharacterized protein LOC113465617 n=1 Tax=Diaphorina citri TaxID=121845 RepID=A0A3Q0IIL2_DIACI|nr:uncharacterized protein LOC113465617 [Diaphorina citri]XP_026676072.1 uncharacterized protein LOC113465617 [Diaphorina citri]
MDRIHNASSLALELSTEFFMIHHEPPLAPPTYTPPPPLVHKTLATPPSSVNILRREVWVMPLFVLSFLTMTLIAMFEVSEVLSFISRQCGINSTFTLRQE